MLRRNFLQGLGPIAISAATGTVLSGFKGNGSRRGPQPPYLKPGDWIGITCPAAAIEQKEARYAEVMLNRWGYKTRLGATVGKMWQNFGGTDQERAADLQRMLDDPYIKAILFGRGGYGSMRMMDMINWDKFVRNPKWLIGYSDITSFHCHINRNFGIPTLHARMAGGFNAQEDESELTLKESLEGKPMFYRWRPSSYNRPGEANGILVGGNLSLIYAMQGSPSELDTSGKILFIEDVGEYKYTIDRMLVNLKRSGKLNKLAGLLVGGFTLTKTDSEGFFTQGIEELIKEKVLDGDFPVAFGFPAGHQRPNVAMKFGMPYQLKVTAKESTLQEPEGFDPTIPEYFGHDTIPSPTGQLPGK